MSTKLNRSDSMQIFVGKADGRGNGIPLLNWSTVCLSKQYCGGMGVAHLELRNLSLLFQWWWKLFTQRDNLWTMVITRLRKK